MRPSKMIMVIITQLCINTVLCLVAQLCLTLWYPMDCSPPGSSVHGDSPGKNTGVGCRALLQGIFPIRGSIPHLPASPALQADSFPTEPPGKPREGVSCGYFMCCAVLCLVTQSCLTLCDPMDCSLPGSSVHRDSPGNNTRMGCQALL